MKKYDIVLIEKPLEDGVSKEEVFKLLELINENEFYLIEIFAKVDSAAMGFISVTAADSLGFDYKASGLDDFIANIIDDMNNETPTGEYQFNGLNILLTR